MLVDYNSLLLALGVSATCLAVTLVGSWFSRRPDTFLLTCSAGLVPIVGGIFIYGAYVDRPRPIFAVLTFVLLFIGFATVWVAGHQFRTRRLSKIRFLLGCLPGIAVSVSAMLVGYDGLAFIGENVVISLLLLLTAREYWLSRHEAPTPLYGITALYTLTAISFALCAAMLIADGKLVLGHAPDNWAEDFSLAVCIAGMTGIGALSLALHQWRQAALHRQEAITDALTGLLNRRALFDLHGGRSFGPSMAVIVFDIDRFKTINDQHGHAAGDLVLKFFGQDLSAGLRASDTVARLGGEEFALVLDNTLPGRAEQVAERVRDAFAARTISIDDKYLTCTVSAGVATGTVEGVGFDDVLRAADKALYEAKRNGRNRVEVAAYLHAV
ncbi:MULTISPECIES: GGDEF domain-containing protein [Rhizobium]|jgi:diguanylate cyclase (GGDEF)-like protein|uniref:diguanylate cyclase n=1 Tax=Rhizobium lusitanum TaxID=293958 RepID=A0A1C3W2M4_9HYPH|nr:MULTISPECIES: GGDEF domain-containing protein [Rhizobium]NKJ05126.1 diguanylate cyclase (GGDEF)-like protein [Rhizobium sp. SG741]NTJ05863.1 GGDEF domain-containing protein [Rhizobium lusitanum]SCB34198.1 diguanylate cyclase (GGDEF) domain-containing protein [Rhizobium lusitanum]